MSRKFSVTYEIVTYESAEDGEAAEQGYIVQDVGLREAIGELNGAAVQPSCYPFDPSYSYVWFSTVDADIDYRTGESEYRSLHLPATLTSSTRLRIARLLGVVKE